MRQVNNAQKRRKTTLALIITGILILLIAGSALAYFFYQSDTTKSSFASAKVPSIGIDESFDGQNWQDVKISLSGNDGEYGAYFIRAAVVFGFVDDEGNVVPITPGAGDYVIDYNTADWTQVGEYWYYNGTKIPGEATENLINSCTEAGGEYHLTVDIVAQCIQANPTSAAQTAWGYVPAN